MAGNSAQQRGCGRHDEPVQLLGGVRADRVAPAVAAADAVGYAEPFFVGVAERESEPVSAAPDPRRPAGPRVEKPLSAGAIVEFAGAAPLSDQDSDSAAHAALADPDAKPDAVHVVKRLQAPLMAAITLARPAVPTVAGRTMRALGTFCSVLVTSPPALRIAARILATELAAIDMACSRFRPDSELTALNQAAGQQVQVSPLLCRALAVALNAAEITSGDVDPTCGTSLAAIGYDRDFGELAADITPLDAPPRAAAGWQHVELDTWLRTVRVPGGIVLDLGATAKALAADVAAESIWSRLGCGVLVNLGGDIAVAGLPPKGGWQVGIDDGVATAPAQVVCIEAGGLATSSPSVRAWRRGDQRLHHILEPSTGRPAEIHWAAASVAGATCVDANIASTASVIRGPAATAWLEGLRMPARLARPDGTVVTTGGWPTP